MVLPLIAGAAARSVSKSSSSEKAANIAGGMSMNMESNLSAFTKALDAFGKNQLPFATAGALTATAFIVRNTVVNDEYPRAFNVRNKGLPRRAFRVDKANKRHLEARVYDSLNKDFLSLQESGGVKTPQGNSIAVPTDNIRLTGRGVNKGRRPRALLSGGKKAFRQKARSGQDVILERRTKKRYPLRVLYVMEPNVKIKPKFAFYTVAKQSAQGAFDKKLPEFLAKARKSAFSKSQRKAARLRR